MDKIFGRVLIVDDSKVLRTSLKNLLIEAGFEVSAFGKPTEALTEVQNKKIDCVITDYEMPEFNGIELCRRLKGNPKTSFIPVLMVSAHENDQRVLKAIRVGADDYFQKTTNPEILISKIKMVIDAKRFRENERLKTYRATVGSLNHELNNSIMIVQAFIERIGQKETCSELFAQLPRLNHALKSLIEKLRGFKDLDEIEFTEYFDEFEIVKLKKKAV